MKQLEKEMNLKQSHVVYSRSLEHLVEEALQAIPNRILPRHTSKSMGRVKQSLIVATTKSIPPRALLWTINSPEIETSRWSILLPCPRCPHFFILNLLSAAVPIIRPAVIYINLDPFFRSAHDDHAHTCNSRWHNELRVSLRASMNQKNSPLECEAENARGQYVKRNQTTLFLLALCMSWIKFHTILWSIRVVRSHLEAEKHFVLLWMQCYWSR